MAFFANPNFEDDMQHDEGIAKGLLPIAESAAQLAKAAAPRRLSHYINSIHAVAGVRDDGMAVARVVSDDFKANWIEKGTGPPIPTEPHAPLRTGAEQATGSTVK